MRVECFRCGREVESRHEGDRRNCKCGAIEVVGTKVAVNVGWLVRNTQDWYRIIGDNRGIA